MSEQQIVNARVMGVRRSATNPREFFDEKPLQELAENIKANGLISPPVVRALPRLKLREPDLVEGYAVVDEKGKVVFDGGTKNLCEHYLKTEGQWEYELIAGERRWRAVQLLKWETMPVIVREADDLSAFKVQMAENLDRESLSAIEEANGYRRAMEKHGMTKEQIAKEFGKSRSHVFSRLRLAEMSPVVKESLHKLGIPDSIAAMVATIPDMKQQLKAIAEIAEGGEYDHQKGKCTCMSARKASAHIEEKYRVSLTGAKFDLKDETVLSGATSCAKCPKRSGNLDPDTTSPNVCTDPGCFNRKEQAVIRAKLKTYEDQGLKVLPAKESKGLFDYYGNDLRSGCGYVRPNDIVPGDKKERTFAEVLKKQGADVKPVVALNKNQTPVKLISLKDAKPALEQAGFKFEERAVDDTGSYQERQERIKQRQPVVKAVMEKVRVAVRAMKVDRGFWELLARKILNNWGWMERNGLQGPDALRKHIKGMAEDELRVAIVEVVAIRRHGELLDYNGEWDERSMEIVKHLGIDVKAVEKEVLKVEEKNKVPLAKSASGMSAAAPEVVGKPAEKKPAKDAKSAKAGKGKSGKKK